MWKMRNREYHYWVALHVCSDGSQITTKCRNVECESTFACKMMYSVSMQHDKCLNITPLPLSHCNGSCWCCQSPVHGRHKPYELRNKAATVLLLLLLILKHPSHTKSKVGWVLLLLLLILRLANHTICRFIETCRTCAIMNSNIAWRYMLVMTAPKLQWHVTILDRFLFC